MPDSNIDIAIRARNQASGAIREVKSEIGGLRGALEQAAGGFDLGGLLTGGIAGFAIGGGINMLVGGVQQAASAVADLSEKGLRLEAVRSSFESLAQSAGQAGGAILSALRQASGGMVSDMDLMLSANKAMMLGVADTADEMTALLEIARTRGQAMGLSVTQAFSDIVTGLGRESALILDNLGIVIDREKAMSDYAASIGTTADALDSVQRKQALVNAVMEQNAAGGGAETAANAFSSLGAAMENLQGTIGTWINENTALIASMNALAGAVQGVNDAMNASRKQDAQIDMFAIGDSITKLMDQAAASQSAIDLIESGLVKGTAEQAQQARMNLDMISVSLDNLVADYNRAAQIAGAPLIDVEAVRRGELAFVDAGAAAAQLAADQQTAAAMAAAHESAIERVRAALANLAGQADVTGAALKSAWVAAAGALGASQALAGFKDSQKELTSLTQEWQYMGLSAEEIEFRKAELVQNTNDDIRAQVRAIDEITNANNTAARAAGGHGAAVAAVNKEYSDLTSKVSGVLAAQLDVGVGVKASDLLPREDDINENARRLADIAANGLNNQEWMDAFMLSAPDTWAELMQKIADGADAKSAAAQILRDFEDGLQPDLIDKTKAKERVKRMLLGEQSMAALAEEIAQELAAEMGIPLSQAMAAAGASLGVSTGAAGEAAAGATGKAEAPDMTGAGASAGATFATGFATSVSGASLVAGVVTSMASADMESLNSSGASAGTQWGAGFVENASGGLLVASIIVKIAAELPRFKDSGASAGTQWGAGFMGTVESGIAQPLITLLTTLVTPGVLAAIQAGNSQTTPP